MRFKHIRSATSLISYNGIDMLIDPALAGKHSYRDIPKSWKEILAPLKRNHPKNDISNINELISADLVLSTHLHFDHFDKQAMSVLPKNMVVLCQSEDEKRLYKAGFTHLKPITNSLEYLGVTFIRIYADHSKFGGTASGYVLKTDNEPTIYFAGDTVYGEHVKETIEKYQPDIVVLNGGGAVFLGEKLIMDLEDVVKTINIKPDATYIIVHLDEIIHCTVKRVDYDRYFSENKPSTRILIPENDEVIDFV